MPPVKLIENDPNESFIGLGFGSHAQPGPPIQPESPGFNETTTGLKFLLQKKHVKPQISVRVSLKPPTHTIKKKKRFTIKTAVFTKLSLPVRVIKDKNLHFFGKFLHFTFYTLKLWRKEVLLLETQQRRGYALC